MPPAARQDPGVSLPTAFMSCCQPRCTRHSLATLPRPAASVSTLQVTRLDDCLLITSIQRCYNPWCATRVGEARVLGPPVAKRPSHQSPKREGRRRIRSKGPPFPAGNTVLDDSQDSKRADTIMSSDVEPPVPAPCLSVPAEEGPSQAAGDTTPYPMLFIHTVEETHLKLRCYYIHANCCWTWQTSGRGAVLSRSSRKSRWRLCEYGTNAMGITSVQNALAIMEDSPHIATPPRKGASQMSMFSDSPLSQAPAVESVPTSAGMWVPPSQGACAKLLARWREWVFALNQPTMRKLPRSTHQLLAQTLDWLVKLIEDLDGLDQPDVIRDCAELLVLCAPLLLWPVPPRPDGAQKLLPHSRVKLPDATSLLPDSGTNFFFSLYIVTPGPRTAAPMPLVLLQNLKRKPFCVPEGEERQQLPGRDCTPTVSLAAMPPHSHSYGNAGASVPGPCLSPRPC